MADTKSSNIELQNHSYATLQISKQEESLYASTQQQQHIYESPQDLNENPAVSSLVIPELESKEVVSSNIQHVTNSVGNYSIQKERVKWSILLLLLIASTLLNVVILITLFTTQVTRPQVMYHEVTNTTEMVQSIVQEALSLRSQEIQERSSNASEEKLLQLIDMSYDNIDLLKTHIELTQSSQQLLVHNITALLVNISNNNIQLLTTHIESSEALQQQQLTRIDNNTQLLEMQTTYAQASQLHLSQNITALLEMIDGISQLVEDHIDSTQSSQQLLVHNITALLDMVNDNGLSLDVTNKNVTSSLQKLNNITNTQSIIEDISVENKGTINNILVKVDDVLETLNSSLVSSCQDIKNKQPNSPSGYYHINSEFVYCEMGELCSTEGGWTRLAYLDMTDSTVDCPTGFKLYESGGVRACGRSIDNAPGCQSIKFPSNGISYSEMCGRVVGYQYGSPDALGHTTNNINTAYVDGISITEGYPRKHIWTLINGVYESNYAATNNCPCNTQPGGVQSPSFVGNDYFCESGNPDSGYPSVLYSNDPLWDGEGCGTLEGNCCAASGLPWFHKTFNSTCSEYLELRVCGSESITNEDTPISFYELYVK